MSEKLVNEFIQKAEAAAAKVTRVKTLDEAYREVLNIIHEAQVHEVGCVATDMTQGLFPLLKEQGIKAIAEGAPRDLARLEIGIVPVDVGIAETGTVAHDATDLYSRYFSMLCPVNIVMLRTSRIKENMTEALKLLENSGIYPAYMAFITGPSRTADIERVLTIGVHGPGRLHIILVDEGE
ncbi:LutC/YkgG family protein [Calderihabitans maritimus]|uniref:Lactate utilization protein B/C n=1 Tax=Calderihabitans maritimus TaxID=1246530 RepID=A0A1Z5HQH0_9FIRM|nr:lactate utilization protein [Calderihabitans maritimus]GAW91561.1 lactate utilization protein B/C [Calderihabitans maritimus]